MVKRRSTSATCWRQLLTTSKRELRSPPYQPSVGWKSIFHRCSQSFEHFTHWPQDKYLFNGYLQTSFKRPAFSKEPTTDIHFIISITILSVLCTIGLYVYCRRRNTNDCLHLHVHLFMLRNSRCVDQNTSTSTGSLPTHCTRPSPSAFRPTTLLSIWDASVRQAFRLESSSSLRLFDIFSLLFN